MPKKKKKKPRRKKLRHPSAESLAARASGLVIHENRQGTLVKLMDEAIMDWFFERDPFVIHLLVCACWMVLCDLGMNHGKGPAMGKHFGKFKVSVVYDFLRHAEAGVLNDAVDLVPSWNHWLVFDAIESFSRLFNGRTVFMRTFQAYYLLRLRPFGIDPQKLEQAVAFLPGGISVNEAMSLGRIEFLDKVSEMFAKEFLAQTDTGSATV